MDMSEIKFKKEIEVLLEKRDLIPEEFWVRTDGGKYEVIWFMDRQKPSVEANYSFDEERFGMTRDGRVIWGFDSGCSCPSPWSSGDFGDDSYQVKEWKEFSVTPSESFDAGWDEECYSNLKDYLLLIEQDISAQDILKVKNAEIKRFLIKRVGYENIKEQVKAEVIHKDGTSELMKFSDGDQYVKVKDSSTDREYLLYVPNHLKTCKSAIAWTFGLSENEYNPIIET
jgi:hypothetical protein